MRFTTMLAANVINNDLKSLTDGNTLVPVNSCLVASSKESNVIGPVGTFYNRTIAGKRRKLAKTKAPEVMLTLFDEAVKVGLSVEYVLFDSWFSNAAQITAIKKNSRIKYGYEGETLNIKAI